MNMYDEQKFHIKMNINKMKTNVLRPCLVKKSIEHQVEEARTRAVPLCTALLGPLPHKARRSLSALGGKPAVTQSLGSPTHTPQKITSAYMDIWTQM